MHVCAFILLLLLLDDVFSSVRFCMGHWDGHRIKIKLLYNMDIEHVRTHHLPAVSTMRIAHCPVHLYHTHLSSIVAKWTEVLSSKCSLPWKCVMFFGRKWLNISFFGAEAHSGFYCFDSLPRNGFFHRSNLCASVMRLRERTNTHRIQINEYFSWMADQRGRAREKETVYEGQATNKKSIAQR